MTGAIKRKERFRTYIKVPELAMFLREITDYRTADMIHLDVPEKMSASSLMRRQSSRKK